MPHVIPEMLSLFRSGVQRYQPEHPKGLLAEDGSPQASLENLRRLGLRPQSIWVRPGRVLIQFYEGELYLALGLSDPKTLANYAADAGWGTAEEMYELYRDIPPDYEGKLPIAVLPNEAQSILDFELDKAKPANRR